MNRLNRIARIGAGCAVLLLVASCDGGYDSGCNYCGSFPAITGYSGTVTGLTTGSSVVLQDDLGATTTASNGSFTLSTYATWGFPATLGVLVQPSGQDCVVSNGTADANGVIPVAVACAAAGSSTAILTDLAGMIYTGGADATGTAASFNSPNEIAVDGSGNIYVADTANNVIRKVTPAGVVTTLAGTSGVSGSADGTGPAASFLQPNAVAVDVSGNVVVADTGNNTIRLVTPAGVVTTLAGTAGTNGSADGTGAAAQFSGPAGLAVDGSGNIYVSDYYSSTIRKIAAGGVVTTYAGTAGSYGSTNGTGAAARFYAPQGLAADGSGNVYVADYGNQLIRKIAPGGVVTTLAGTAGTVGHADGTGTAALFYGPIAVASDAAGNLYVADSYNYSIRKVDTAGVVSTVVGSSSMPVFNAGPLPGSLEAPLGVALFGTTLYVTDNNGIAAVSNVP